MASQLPSRTFGKLFGYAQKSLGLKEVTNAHATNILNIAYRKVLISVGANDARQRPFEMSRCGPCWCINQVPGAEKWIKSKRLQHVEKTNKNKSIQIPTLLNYASKKTSTNKIRFLVFSVKEKNAPLAYKTKFT